MNASPRPTRVLVIDHEDSFVFNLVDELRGFGAMVRSVRARLSLAELEDELSRFAPDLVVLSPGPGTPSAARTTVSWLMSRPTTPVLGVCLGHQALAVAAGGRVGRAAAPVHGESHEIELADDPIFADLPRRMRAARYHSLVVTHLPTAFREIATCAGEVMAIRHSELPQIGLQFHPESFLTPYGGSVLRRVLAASRARPNQHEIPPNRERQ